ncbi:MAG: hypothetical protein Ct9H300mP8_11380 [Gammaproteobacteria bacterium]|nr:MAG: hypothetical protein Ct9H300mP8_11380 [Gammaproteobacteria bacterium]
MILEFSTAKNPLLKTAYRFYQQSWPIAGQLIAGNSAPYRYLIESIDVHPNQSELNAMIGGPVSAKFVTRIYWVA